MHEIEQAIFTSAETGRSVGYQVVAKSPGVCEADAHELVVWGPSHDSMLELDSRAVSVNFHPLPSGAFCVSQTTPAGWEYSGRGGHRVYTQCLIVPADVLARFANNPFALMKAALAGGMLKVHRRVPGSLEPLRLTGSAAPVDQALLARLANNPGAKQMAVLVQSALDSVCLAVSGEPSAAELIAGLLQCLPVECRSEFSFSTGLKFSSRRPFRIVALTDDPARQRWLAHQPNVTVRQLSRDLPPVSMPIDGWARLVGRVLSAGRISFLATQLSKRRFQLTRDDLPALGLQLLEDVDASAFSSDHADEEETAFDFPALSCEDDRLPAARETDAAAPLQRAHAAHRRPEKSSPLTTTTNPQAAKPSEQLDASSPEVLEKLEQLDDLVYEAVAGQTIALEQLVAVWPQTLAELGDELVADSRERYLRYALSIWEKCAESDGVRNPTRAVRALDVLCLLFEDR